MSAKDFHNLARIQAESFRKIGSILFPNAHISEAQMAVSRYAKRVLSPEEYEAMRERNRSEGPRKQTHVARPNKVERNKERCGSTSINKLWTPAEKASLIVLAASPELQYSEGRYANRPCYPEIAPVLQTMFDHTPEERSTNGINRRYNRLTNGEWDKVKIIFPADEVDEPKLDALRTATLPEIDRKALLHKVGVTSGSIECLEELDIF